MKTLALRIYLAVVTVLLLFALVAGWLAQRNLEHERQRFQSQSVISERTAAWAELIENSLPGATLPEAEQRQALLDWSERLRMPLALDNPRGQRIATSPLMIERLGRLPKGTPRLQSTRLTDGRTLWVLRPGPPGSGNRGRDGGRPPERGPETSATTPAPQAGPMGQATEPRGMERRPPPGDGDRPPPPRVDPWLSPFAWMLPTGWAGGAPGLVLMLVLLFAAVAAGAWPVANRLTRRLKALRQGVERFGQGQLQHRVEVEGKDEVADVARSFNQAAQRIEELVTAHRNLLANASHELRSPLARMKMAVAMLADAPPDRSARFKEEIHQDIHELDALVEEVLLASRLDARPQIDRQKVDLMGLLIEEAQRTGAEVNADADTAQIALQADERLLRRAVRNLLENARRYGRTAEGHALVEASLRQTAQHIDIVVADRGPGVPKEQCERIFEPFYRLPGHAEHAGGVGLGLSLVRQIAQRHGGEVRCEAREGGGSQFVIQLPRHAA
ncbi:MAG: HAMP domain-containing histidine kinase [Rubrivivax sp.]|nr:MAG: HAMP domain-containing histidine kinase [Rubrivivax sp.]